MRVLIACEVSGVVRDAFLDAGHDAISCDLSPTASIGPHFAGNVLHLLDGWQPVRFTAECDQDGDDYCYLTDRNMGDCPCIWPTQDGVEYMEVDGELLGRKEDEPHWDLMIAHPPCTYLSSSGLHWNGRVPGRQEKTDTALEFVRQLMAAPIPRICIENPIGCIGTQIRKADQTIQPYQFGDDASKATCLWLKGLPPLRPTQFVNPRMVCCGMEIANGDKYGCPNCNGEKVARPRWANQTDSGQNRLGPSPTRAADRAKTYPGIARAMAEQWSTP